MTAFRSIVVPVAALSLAWISGYVVAEQHFLAADRAVLDNTVPTTIPTTRVLPDGGAYAPLPDRYQWDETEWCYYNADGSRRWCVSDSDA